MEVVRQKINDPWHDYSREYAPDKNEAKRNFRILVPVIARLAGGSEFSVQVVRFGLQGVLLICLLLAAERVCGDRTAALGLAMAVSATHVGTEIWWDVCFWFDNCAHACK